MMIPINKNFDSYKDDFFKGLTMRQTLFTAATAVTVTISMLVCQMVLHLNSTISFYISFALALPLIAMGFLKVQGMTFMEFVKKQREASRQPVYFYVPELIYLQEKGIDILSEEEKGEIKKTEAKPKKLCIQTEDSMDYIEGRLERIAEENEGLSGTDKETVSGS